MQRFVTAGMLAALLAGAPAAGGAAGFGPERRPGAVLPAALSSLQARAASIARDGGARIGLAAIDLATGDMVSVNGGERFPMASTVKVAIAALFLHDVQSGRLRLDAAYALPSAERRLAARLGDMRRLGAGLTGAELIELMLTRSDNSAADILLGAVGGTRAVGDWLARAGVAGQRVDRSIAQLLDDHQVRRRARIGRGRRRHWIEVAVPRRAPAGDERDSSTPEAMALLLAKLRSGQLLDADRTAYLFEVMARCRTGARRIPGLLPAGTPVAHKTGTLTGVTNDVGVVGLPNGHQLAIALFATGRGAEPARDRSLARLSRLLYDGFSAASAAPDADAGMGGSGN